MPKMASPSATLNVLTAIRRGIARLTGGLKVAARKAKGLKVNSTVLRKEQLQCQKTLNHG